MRPRAKRVYGKCINVKYMHSTDSKPEQNRISHTYSACSLFITTQFRRLEGAQACFGRDFHPPNSWRWGIVISKAFPPLLRQKCRSSPGAAAREPMCVAQHIPTHVRHPISGCKHISSTEQLLEHSTASSSGKPMWNGIAKKYAPQRCR
jgi:hypothetical protein